MVNQEGSAGVNMNATIIAIRDFLNNTDGNLSLEQFAIDWIEEEADRAQSYLESDEIVIDDETYRGAVHYRAGNVLEVLRADAACRKFFTDLEVMTRQERNATA